LFLATKLLKKSEDGVIAEIPLESAVTLNPSSVPIICTTPFLFR
jgi:hypothetical protein